LSVLVGRRHGTGIRMRTLIVALAVVAIMTAPAFGRGGGGKSSAADQQQTEDQKKKNAAAEKAYKAAVDRIPDRKYDPWGSVRK
jgi:hypothetical protein